MGGFLKSYVDYFIYKKTQRRRAICILLILSIFAASGVFWKLRLTGITMVGEDPVCCGMEEHMHNEECFETDLICETEETAVHAHADECYKTKLICSIEEHNHTLDCCSDKTADIETAEEWESVLKSLILTGDWADDLLTVSETQLGYMESSKNFIADEDGLTRRGYTRYGEWYGNPYGNWSAMFISYCLHYAGIPDELLPYAAGCYAWTAELGSIGIFEPAGDFLPLPGDLVFFDTGNTGIANHAGIITKVTAQREFNSEILAETEKIIISTIEGDYENMVAENSYELNDSRIIGFGNLGAAYEKYALSTGTGAAEDLSRNNQGDGKIDEGSGNGAGSGETDGDGSGLPAAGLLSGQEGIMPTYTPLAFIETITGAPDYIGTIDSANSWQIVSYPYIGRELEYKTLIDSDNDGYAEIALQKNVVPTGTENEFLVYLSMDSRLNMKELLDKARLGVTTSNKYDSLPLFHALPEEEVAGNFSPDILPHGESGGTRSYLITLHVYANSTDTTPLYTYQDTRYGDSPNCSNGTLLIKLAGNPYYIVIQQKVNLDSSGILTANIYLDQLSGIMYFPLYDTVFDTVEDIMGPYTEFMGVVDTNGDAPGGEAVDGTYSYNTISRKLTWLPVENAEALTFIEAESLVTGWMSNATQLVYKIRLNVEAEGFMSCAANMNSVSTDPETYDVNQSAVLSYHLQPLVPSQPASYLTSIYPIPQVRGLLYNISLIKDYICNGAPPTPGAHFALFEADGTTPVVRKGLPLAMYSDPVTGAVRFNDLPWGTYVLKETQPEHYITPAQTQWSLTLCHTTTPGTLAQDPEDLSNMRWAGNDGVDGIWTIINTEKSFSYGVIIQKTDEGGISPLANARFKLSPDPANPTGTLEGTTDAAGTISFGTAAYEFKLNTEYTISEIKPPDGYGLMNIPIRFRIEKNPDVYGYRAVLINAAELSGVCLNITNFTETYTAERLTLSVTVNNIPGFVLPETGGTGTLIYTLGGLLLIAISFTYASRLRCRRERRANF